MGLVSTKLYGLVLVPLIFTAFVMILVPAYAQEGEYMNRRIEIWGLFYDLMTAAFIVGAVVQGTMLYIAVHFREGRMKKVKVKEEAKAKAVSAS